MSKVQLDDNLKVKGLLVKLTRKKINHNKMDPTIAKEVRKSKGITDASALRVNKTIIPKSAMDPITRILNETGKHFYKITVPWDEKCFRLMSIDQYEDFVKYFKRQRGKFVEAVNEFIETIGQHIEHQKGVLGKAFKADDYSFMDSRGNVDREMLLGIFEMKVDYDTIKEGTVDIRASLTKEDRENLENEITARLNAQFADSQRHLAQKLYDAVEHMHNKLSTADTVFRNTLVSNVEEIVAILPKMNISGDQALEKLIKRAEKDLCRFSADDLRSDEDAAKATAKAAEEILDGMAGMV